MAYECNPFFLVSRSFDTFPADSLENWTAKLGNSISAGHMQVTAYFMAVEPGLDVGELVSFKR